MKSPMISVVICAYNEEARVAEAIESLFLQTANPDDFEIVFVDDGSEDRTWSIVNDLLPPDEAIGRPTMRLHRIEHAGLSIARNTGIAESRGEIVSFLDADAIAAPDWIERIRGRFQADAQLGVLGGRIEILNPESAAARMLDLCHYDHSDRRDIIGANMSYRRDIFDEVGGFWNCFASRGDETSLLRRISGRHPVEKDLDLKVKHERPESIIGWFGERRANGRFFAWCERLDGAPIDRAVSKRVTTLAGLILPWLGFIAWPLALLGLPGAIAVMRRQLRGPTRHLWPESFRRHGMLGGLMPALFGSVLNLIGDAYSDWGYIKGAYETPGPDGASSALDGGVIEERRAYEAQPELVGS